MPLAKFSQGFGVGGADSQAIGGACATCNVLDGAFSSWLRPPGLRRKRIGNYFLAAQCGEGHGVIKFRGGRES